MRPMKKLLILGLALLLAGGSFCNARAAARSSSNRGRDYVVGNTPMERWSCGIYAEEWTRDVMLRRYFPEALEYSKIMAYAGYDLLPWLMTYAAVGNGGASIGQDSSDDKVVYGLGLQINLMDHEVPYPGLMEDRLRINAAAEYLWAGTDWLGEEIKWGEFSSSLTVSIVNDLSGNVLFIPDTIAVYCGPIYSSVSGDEISGDGRAGFGIAGGLEIFYSKRVSMHVQYNKLDHAGYSTGLNVRF